jgi:hypothetical protein
MAALERVSRAGADEIREAARAAHNARSIRRLAAEMKVSAAGLRYFLRGGKPYPHTLAKLRLWYVVHGPKVGEDAVAAGLLGLGALLDLLPQATRPVACAYVLSGLRRACREFGQSLPEGLEEAITASAGQTSGAQGRSGAWGP